MRSLREAIESVMGNRLRDRRVIIPLAAEPMKAATKRMGAAIAGMMEAKTATVRPIRKG